MFLAASSKSTSGREDEVFVGLDRVVVDRAGGVDAGLEDQVGEGEDDCGVLV